MKKFLFFVLLSNFVLTRIIVPATSKVASAEEISAKLADWHSKICAPLLHPACLETILATGKTSCSDCLDIFAAWEDMQALNQHATLEYAQLMIDLYAPDELLLHAAANQNIFALIYALIMGANANSQANHLGKTALHVAAEQGNPTLISILVTCKANVNVLYDIESTALSAAIHANSPLTLEELLQGVPTQGILNHALATALRTNNTAFRERDRKKIEPTTDMIKLLCRAGANANKPLTSLRKTGLHLAAECGNLSVAQILIDYGAHPGIADLNGMTPRTLAQQHDNPQVTLAFSYLFARPEVSRKASFKNKDGEDVEHYVQTILTTTLEVLSGCKDLAIRQAVVDALAEVLCLLRSKENPTQPSSQPKVNTKFNA